jgi:hypothetical protein
MATKPAADSDSTSAFHTPVRLGSSASATEGAEATYWPGLRGPTGGVDLLPTPEVTTTTSRLAESSTPEVTPLIHLSRRGMPHRRFQVLQQWEGVVTRIAGDWFEADLRDLMNPKNPMEVAELPFAEISPADKHLIGPGCVFYWVIGYETRAGGQISRMSEIRVRRAPRWTRRKLDALKTRARELFTLEGEDGEEAGRPE